MTDNEIIKVLECCVTYEFCTGCPLVDNCPSSYSLLKSALDLINRQKAEIEKLKRLEENLDKLLYMLNVVDIGQSVLEEQKHTIRAEAKKEFAERAIKKICEKVYAPTPVQSCIVEKCNQVIIETAKEMVGEG